VGLTRARASLAIALFLPLAVILACSDTERAHVFAGRLYESDRGCLDSVAGIDVVDGPVPASSCFSQCLVSPPDADSGLRTVYVSTMCAPFPPAFDTSGSDPRCADALDAYARNTSCLTDGGISNLPDAAARD
jgi:hypothetical protein